MLFNGQVPVFDSGIVLRGIAPIGSRCNIYAGDGLRVVGHVGEILRMLEVTGVDLNTRAERPLASLSPMERLERLEAENAQLRANAAR